jgi:hypothetical protein
MTKTELKKAMRELEKVHASASDAIDELNEAVINLCTDVEGFIGEKSETWQESEVGQFWAGVLDELIGFEAEVPELPTLD